MSEATRPGTPGWQQRHRQRYEETNGEDGHMWQGVPTLLLTTKGSKSGNPYTTPLIYGQDANRYLIVASYGGAPKNPQWYRNLVANPEIEVQVVADKFKAKARTATADEKQSLWPKMAAIWPAYDDYQSKTDRDIPVVVLERI